MHEMESESRDLIKQKDQLLKLADDAAEIWNELMVLVGKVVFDILNVKFQFEFCFDLGS